MSDNRSEQNAAKKFTSNIHFDEQHMTFRLYSKDSLYAFCISPELSLEHLYYGEKITDRFDLRYLSQTARAMAFNTIESCEFFSGDVKVKDSFVPSANLAKYDEGNALLSEIALCNSAEELQKIWRRARLKDTLENKRLEYRTWRSLSRNVSDLNLGDIEKFDLDKLDSEDLSESAVDPEERSRADKDRRTAISKRSRNESLRNPLKMVPMDTAGK